VIEMKDHVIVVEAPLNDERALAVLAEVRTLIPNKPIRYVVVSHQHFDHAGGVRAAAGEGITLVTHEASKAFLERVITLPATVNPDHLAKSGKKAMVEGVRDRRVLSDGTRTVEIRHIAGILHADDMLMVYLPKEKLLIEADAYTPPAPNVAPMTPPNPFTISLVENITKQGLAVDRFFRCTVGSCRSPSFSRRRGTLTDRQAGPSPRGDQAVSGMMRSAKCCMRPSVCSSVSPWRFTIMWRTPTSA